MHAVAPVAVVYVPAAQLVHAEAPVAAVYVPALQPVHAVRPLEAAMLPGVHAVHVRAVVAAHVSVTSWLLHVYMEDARLPAYPALHIHVIWYGCEFAATVAPLCTALAGAAMAAHALHVMDAGVHAPVAPPQDVDTGATP